MPTHILCPSCRNQFIPDEGPPDREVACRWCQDPLRLEGGSPVQENWAEHGLRN